VGVGVCVWERYRARESVCVCQERGHSSWRTYSPRMFLCVCERERERERDRESVFVCACVRAFFCETERVDRDQRSTPPPPPQRSHPHRRGDGNNINKIEGTNNEHTNNNSSQIHPRLSRSRSPVEEGGGGDGRRELIVNSGVVVDREWLLLVGKWAGGVLGM